MNKASSTKEYEIIIDVVAESYYNQEHIKGAINICAYEMAFVEKVEKQFPDKQTKLLVYGPTDAEGQYAYKKLEAAGYEQAAYLEGGLDRYSDEGGDVEITSRYTPPKIENGTYTIDRENSIIKWVGRNKGNSHHGTIECTNGVVEVIAGGITKASFSIDPHTIEVEDLKGSPMHAVLKSHLHHSDFFDVKKHPQFTFEVINVTPIDRVTGSENNYDVVSELIMRGKTNKVLFEASIHPKDESSISVQAHFDLDRTDWGMVYGSERFLRQLGMHVLKDEMSIELQLVFVKK